MSETKEKKQTEIAPGDVVSVPFGNKFLAGIVKEVNDEKITINNYKNSDVEIPNNNKVYKFFPGQKFDIREFDRVDQNSTDNLSIKEKLNKFLSKTEVGSFSNMIAKQKGDLVQLLKGEMTNTMFKGQSIFQTPEGKQQLKNWACKFELYRGKDGNLKMNTTFQQEQLQTKVYGVELTPEQLTNTMEKKQSVVIDRVTNEGKPFKAFCKFDKDLNAFVTSQYVEKIAEKMKAAYAKREEVGQGETKKEEPKNVFKEKNEKAASEDVKPKMKKGRGI